MDRANLKGRRGVIAAIVAASAIGLAACSGSNTASAPSSGPATVGLPAPATQAKIAAVSVQVKFPAASARAGGTDRAPQYISPASAGLVLSVYNAAATPPPSPTLSVDVSSTSTFCVSDGKGGRLCTFGFNAPVGNDAFSISIYDQKQSGGTSAPSGNVLSTQTAYATVAQSQTNVVQFALGGVVSSIVVSPQSIALTPNGSPQTVTVYVVARDADGFIIMEPSNVPGASPGPAPFAFPISIAISGDSNKVLSLPGGTSVVTASASGPVAVSVGYNGAPVSGPITLTASVSGASGVLPGAAVFTSGTSTGTLPITIPGYSSSALYVGNAPSVSTTASPVPPGVLRFAAGASGSATPTATLNEVAVVAMTTDTSGNLYLAERSQYPQNYYAQVVKYQAATAPVAAATPVATISSYSALCKPNGIAVDSQKNVYVSNDSSCSGVPRIAVFAAGATGYASPAWTLTDPGLTNPQQIAIDASDNLYVANGSTNSVFVYAPGARSTAAPMRTIAGGSTNIIAPVGVAIDVAGNIVVRNGGATPAVNVFPPNATGNAPPSKTFSSSAMTPSFFGQIAVDTYGNFVLANGTNVIAFPPNAAGSTVTPIAVNLSSAIASATAVAVSPTQP